MIYNKKLFICKDNVDSAILFATTTLITRQLSEMIIVALGVKLYHGVEG